MTPSSGGVVVYIFLSLQSRQGEDTGVFTMHAHSNSVNVNLKEPKWKIELLVQIVV